MRRINLPQIFPSFPLIISAPNQHSTLSLPSFGTADQAFFGFFSANSIYPSLPTEHSTTIIIIIIVSSIKAHTKYIAFFVIIFVCARCVSARKRPWDTARRSATMIWSLEERTGWQQQCTVQQQPQVHKYTSAQVLGKTLQKKAGRQATKCSTKENG